MSSSCHFGETGDCLCLRSSRERNDNLRIDKIQCVLRDENTRQYFEDYLLRIGNQTYVTLTRMYSRIYNALLSHRSARTRSRLGAVLQEIVNNSESDFLDQTLSERLEVAVDERNPRELEDVGNAVTQFIENELYHHFQEFRRNQSGCSSSLW